MPGPGLRSRGTAGVDLPIHGAGARDFAASTNDMMRQAAD